ncbi:hypothetical protein [Caballeronia temeraria]|nr:hypothetical protein [Caballeronia temeraria]
MQGTKKRYQAEHILPCSAMHESGRSGPKFGDCGDYSTSGALTWMVSDGQSEGQEHKLLTDPMREFSQQNELNGTNATRDEWMKKYEEATKKALKDGKKRREIKDSTLDRDDLIDKAAKCIRLLAEQAFEDAGITAKTKLRNPWDPTKEQVALKKAATAAKKAVTGKRG